MGQVAQTFTLTLARREDAPTLAEQIAELKREHAMRQRVYRSWIASGRMKQAAADQYMAGLCAALDTLQALFDAGAR